jgi:S-(hydroxymethyl)glutathione dehydrogenase / alcohol dehydrogenase
MKTISAILIEQRNPLVIDEVDIPRLRYGQVLVEVMVSRICGSQLGEIDGVKGPDKYLPHLMGHEAGGVVREVGPSVTHVNQDDRVVLHWRPGAGIDAGPTEYQLGGRIINAGPITTFQQFTVISENRLTPIPKKVDFETAALLADTLTTGFGAATRESRIEIGEAAVVIGVGGIGLGTVLGVHLAGAHPLIAVDLFDHKLEKAKEFGATHTINSSSKDFAEEVLRILGCGADAIFDGTGNPDVLQKAWGVLSPQGRLVLIGVMTHDLQFSFNTLPLHFGKRIVGSEGGHSRPHIDIPRYLRMIDDGRFDPSKMITHRCKLEEINSAICAMRAGETVHTMIHFDP